MAVRFVLDASVTIRWAMQDGSIADRAYADQVLDYPLAPLVPALVLGDRAEDAFRQSMLASQGGMGIFWNNGLVGTIMTLAVLGLVAARFGAPALQPARRHLTGAAQDEKKLPVGSFFSSAPSTPARTGDAGRWLRSWP